MNLKFIVIFLVSGVISQNRDTLDVIRQFGYKGESYQINTADGYLLTIHRILPNKIEKVRKPPILLMHGILSLSLQFLQLQNDSLPFILSNSGYDVFLANTRGTKYSSHLKFSKKSSEFWNFSFHEIGLYDLPAMIDSILEITRSQKLFYIASSQGAAVSLVLLSLRPEYNEKIIQAHFLGPAVYIGSRSNLILRSSHKPFTRHQMVDFSRLNNILRPIFARLCANRFGVIICIFLEFLSYGFNIDKVEVDFGILKTYIDYHASSVSEGQLLHFHQISNSRKFQQFNYGNKNLRIYGTRDPPEYDLNRVTIPIYIYWGTRDSLVRREDIQRLRDSLPNNKGFDVIKNFNHFDFEASRRAKYEVYLKIVKYMDASLTG